MKYIAFLMILVAVQAFGQTNLRPGYISVYVRDSVSTNELLTDTIWAKHPNKNITAADTVNFLRRVNMNGTAYHEDSTFVMAGNTLMFADTGNTGFMGIRNTSFVGRLDIIFDAGGGSEGTVASARSTGFFTTDLFPMVSTNYSLGSASGKWRDLYISSLIAGRLVTSDGNKLVSTGIDTNEIVQTDRSVTITGRAPIKIQDDTTQTLAGNRTWVIRTSDSTFSKAYSFDTFSDTATRVLFVPTQPGLVVVSIRAIRLGGTSASINVGRWRSGSLVQLLSSDYVTTTTEGSAGTPQNTDTNSGDMFVVELTAVAGSPPQVWVQVTWRYP